MNYRLLLLAGIISLMIGMLYPLGIVEAVIIKYLLYAGIVIIGIGILYLPNNHEKSD